MKIDHIQKFVFSILKESNPVEISENDYNAICKYLKKNKISFIDFERKNNIPKQFLQSKEFQSFLSSERELYNQWVIDFEDVRKAWESEGIEYLFHKSIGQFPYQSDNLDLLVRTKDYVIAGEALKKINYVNLRNIQEAHKEYYRKFNCAIAKGPIHLHERVCWVVPFDDIDHLWENKQHNLKEDAVYYPHPNDSILTTSIHCFIEDHIIKAKDILFLKSCINNNDIDWTYIIDTAKKNHFEHALFTAFIIMEYLHHSIYGNQLFPQSIIDECWIYVNKKKWIRNTLRKILKKEAILPFRIPHLWTRVHSALRELKDPSFGSVIKRYYQVFGGLFDRLIHLKFKIHNQPNFHIAISGLDGSGKSTYINNLIQNFNDCDIKTKLIWHRAGSMKPSSYLLQFRRALSRKKNKSLSATSQPREKVNNKFANSAFRILYFIDMLFYNIKLRFYLIKGQVVISDRYVIDDIVDIESINPKPNTSRILYRIIEWLNHKPELHYYIDTKPELIRERVKTPITEDLDNNHKAYKDLLNKKNYLIINNSSSFKETYNKFSHTTLSKYFSKYPEKFSNYVVKSFRYK